MATNEIRVLVVDDQALIRGAVVDLIEHEDDLTAVGQAANGQEAIAATREYSPDVILMDIRMPVMDGIEATRILFADKGMSGGAKVLILTTFEEEDYIIQALRAGASGFLGKGADPVDLISAIRTIHNGDALLSPAATRALIDQYARQESTPIGALKEPFASLTERELEVLQLVGKGLSNQELGELLSISPLTAKTHVHRIMGKIGVHDRTQMVIACYEAGLVLPGRG